LRVYILHFSKFYSPEKWTLSRRANLARVLDQALKS